MLIVSDILLITKKGFTYKELKRLPEHLRDQELLFPWRPKGFTYKELKLETIRKMLNAILNKKGFTYKELKRLSPCLLLNPGLEKGFTYKELKLPKHGSIAVHLYRRALPIRN